MISTNKFFKLYPLVTFLLGLSLAVKTIYGSEFLQSSQVRDQLRINPAAGFRLVNYWASWCSPCIQKLPVLQKLQHSYPESLLLVTLASIDINHGIQKAENILQNKNIKIQNYFISYGDPEKLINDIDPKWGGDLPYSILYNSKGKILARLSGNKIDFESVIRKWIGPPPKRFEGP